MAAKLRPREPTSTASRPQISRGWSPRPTAFSGWLAAYAM